MRHRTSGRHLSRTPAHHRAMRRNMAQSLFQHGQIETTLTKAKEIRPFVERLITLARRGDLQSRRRLEAELGDRGMIDKDQLEAYEAMSDAQRRKVRVAPTGRRHRTGAVPAAYNKKKIPFVARSVIHKLMTEIAPRYQDRPGGYTRIIRLAKRRIGDNSDLAILQLVGEEKESAGTGKRKSSPSRRRVMALNRIRQLEIKDPRRKAGSEKKPDIGADPAPSSEAAESGPADSQGAES